MAPQIDGYAAEEFAYEGKSRTIYRRGSGPAVIVIAEMPGITPNVVQFADRVVDVGCTAVLPWLFGEPGRPISAAYAMQSLAPACVSREFSVWATGRTSPIIEWLRALARHEHERCGGPGVGAIGMCFTGGFALGMAVDDELLAPVLSQPSLPFGITKRHRRDPGVSREDLAKVKARCQREDLCVLGLRFSADRMSPADRFQTLKDELGDCFVAVEIDSARGNPHGNPVTAHSVLTEHLLDEPGHPTHDALNQVLDLFRTKLVEPTRSAPTS